jgi:hypothetical protein
MPSPYGNRPPTARDGVFSGDADVVVAARNEPFGG